MVTLTVKAIDKQINNCHQYHDFSLQLFHFYIIFSLNVKKSTGKSTSVVV